MNDISLESVLQNKSDTAENFTNSNPKLRVGVIGYESDTGKFKIGDGISYWKDLKYSSISISTNIIDDADDDIKAVSPRAAKKYVDDNVFSIEDQIVMNIFKPTFASTTLSGVTITANDDYTYTLKGNCTSNEYITLGTIIIPTDSEYVLSGGASDCFVSISGGATSTDIGSGSIIDDEDKGIEMEVEMNLISGTTYNRVVGIMIEKGTMIHKYVPYINDKTKLNEAVAKIASRGPFKGATDSVNGEQGFVPQPVAGSATKVLKGNGSWEYIATYSDTDIVSGVTALPTGALYVVYE